MNTLIVRKYDFAGSIQRNLNEYLEAAIGYHYDTISHEEARALSTEERKEDVTNIADNLIGEADAVSFPEPDSREFTREELEAEILEKIEEMYN